MSAPVLVSTLKMHAHRCEACAAKGKETVWLHPDMDRGQVAAHKCPECGTINWKQSAIDNGKLPAPLPANKASMSFDAVLGWLLIFVAIGAIGYFGYIIYKKKQVSLLA